MKTIAKPVACFFVAIMGATTAIAQDTLPAQLSACLQITGLLQRLACYDRVAHSVSPAVRNLPAQRPLASAAPPAYVAPPIAAAPPIAVPPPTGLGSERLARPSAVRRPREETAGISSISYDPRGRFTVTLDNGQVWRQLEGDTSQLQATRISKVRISRGALGSYDLNVVGRNATYRVSRLQ